MTYFFDKYLLLFTTTKKGGTQDWMPPSAFYFTLEQCHTLLYDNHFLSCCEITTFDLVVHNS
ncbi:MAG TPA: hypothetical protein PLY70_13150, partial [Saprospiraceae bacterium]|nr:hypothetical protein [Saprospiraceae bacterium]